MKRNMTDWRPKWRAAQTIHNHLSAVNHCVSPADPPQEIWREMMTTAERLQQAMSRGWRMAAQRVLEDLHYVSQRLGRELEVFRQRLTQSMQATQASTTGEILAELSALEAEFDDVELDANERTLSLTVGPIELEDIQLGRFRVVLHWERIGRGRAYEIQALEPCPAEDTDDVTHPHVRDGQLCEGEGTAPIKSALAQGRLFDFFTIVKQVLETYNAESAHVMLDRWDGVGCRDCGSRMSRDEHGNCDRCNDPLCSDCSTHCSACDAYTCSGCSGECAECGDYFCCRCLNTDTESSRLLCPGNPK